MDKGLDKLGGGHSRTLMGKNRKSSREYSSGFVPEDRHAVEVIEEFEGSVSQGHDGSGDSSFARRKRINLNLDKSDGGVFMPTQAFSLSKLSGSKRKNLEMRLKVELERVQKFQKTVLSRVPLKPNGVAASGSPFANNFNHAAQNMHQSNCGVSVNFESTKQDSSPLSISVLMKQCETLLKRLMQHQYAWVFNTPVDVAKLNIPDYFTVIKRPMDLGTIKSKIASCAYSSPQDFATDVRLTFSNAMTYNPPKNDVHVMADAMSKLFEMRWKPLEKKMATAEMDIKTETRFVKPKSETSKRKFSSVDHVTVLDSDPKMSDEEKLNLSRRMQLIPEMPQHIIDFLKQHIDIADQDGGDEMEIDFDSFSFGALCHLKKLLNDYAQGNTVECLRKNESRSMIFSELGVSNSSKRPCKDKDMEICGNDFAMTCYSPVDRGKNKVPSSCSGTTLRNSHNKSGPSFSDVGNATRNEPSKKVFRPLNTTKEIERNQGAIRRERGPVNGVDQTAQNAHRKTVLVTANGSQEGENTPSEKQASPDKLYRAALLKGRFADTILKAREKTLDQCEKKDPEKLRQEREELERQQREERARLQAEAKAAEDARLKADAEAAAEAKRRRELEREAARQALSQMEKTVEINENSLFLKDLEMLRSAPAEHIPGSSIDINLDCSGDGIDGFKLSGSNPLEQLGLFIKADDDEEGEDEVGPSCAPQLNDVEEGEIN